MIPYGRQLVEDDDVAAVVAVLKGDWLTQGPAVTDFEDALAATVGARHCVTFANGTVALHAAVVAAGLTGGDRLGTSSLSFAASANCARYVGADVAFVDIDPETLNIDVSAVPAGLDSLVPVHYAGLPVELPRLAHRPRVVIEDAAHALGSLTPDGPVGNCAHSDMCMFSFHPVKVITTGEGGAITTNSDALADSLRTVRNHGIVRRPEEGGWFYEIGELGFNYRLTDMQAALGLSQLAKLDRFIARRNELADRYRAALADVEVELPPAAPAGWRHAYHLFPIRVADRRRVYDQLRERGVAAQVHFVPIHRHPLYAAQAQPELPETVRAYERLLSLPLFPALRDDEQDQVISALKDVL